MPEEEGESIISYMEVYQLTEGRLKKLVFKATSHIPLVQLKIIE